MELLATLLVLLLVARVLGEIASRLGQPSLLGELVAGVALGALTAVVAGDLGGLADLPEDPVFIAIADLGIFFLMLLAGIELKTSELTESSSRSSAVAVGGMALPLAAGFGGAWLALPDSDAKLAQSLFLGTALAITAVPTSIRVLMDLGVLHTRVGRTIVSAALIDDILSLVLLALLSGLVRDSDLGAADFLLLLGQITVFLAITLLVGRVVAPRLRPLFTSLETPEFEFSSLLMGALALAVLAEALQLHFIIGAFAAGLVFERRHVGADLHEVVTDRVSGITHGFLAPIFFVSIGLQLDLSALTEAPLLIVTLVLGAFATKLVGAGIPARLLGLSTRESFAVGAGMSARGAVELIVADIALGAGIFETPAPPPAIVEHLFSAVVITAIVTTLATPFALGAAFRGMHPENDGSADRHDEAEHRAATGSNTSGIRSGPST